MIWNHAQPRLRGRAWSKCQDSRAHDSLECSLINACLCRRIIGTLVKSLLVCIACRSFENFTSAHGPWQAWLEILQPAAQNVRMASFKRQYQGVTPTPLTG